MKTKIYLQVTIVVFLLSTINSALAQYCIPNPTDGATYDTYIDSVSLHDINNQDSYSPTDTSYNDYTTNYNTLLTHGQTYNLTIKGSPYYFNMHYIAWIDYNNDNEFSVAEEKLGEYVTTIANEIFSIPFTVPSSATISTTRLRVRCVWNITNPDPCIDYQYGETEDYTVSISDYQKIGTGILNNYGDLAFFNYNTDGDYDILLHD